MNTGPYESAFGYPVATIAAATHPGNPATATEANVQRPYQTKVPMSWNTPQEPYAFQMDPQQQIMQPLPPSHPYPSTQPQGWNTQPCVPPQNPRQQMMQPLPSSYPYPSTQSSATQAPVGWNIQPCAPSPSPMQQMIQPLSDTQGLSSQMPRPYAPVENYPSEAYDYQPHPADQPTSYLLNQPLGNVGQAGSLGTEQQGSAVSVDSIPKPAYFRQTTLEVVAPNIAKNLVEPYILKKQPKLNDLMKVLAKFSQKWRKIGMLLCVEMEFLDRMSGDRLQPRNCLENVLKQWLTVPQSIVTWEYLIEALRLNESELPEVADRVIGFLALPEIYNKYR